MRAFQVTMSLYCLLLWVSIRPMNKIIRQTNKAKTYRETSGLLVVLLLVILSLYNRGCIHYLLLHNSITTNLASFFFLMFIFETERNRAWVGEGQRERETQNLKQAPGSELSAQSPTRGSNPLTMRSWPEPTNYEIVTQTPNQLSHPGAPTNLAS